MDNIENNKTIHEGRNVKRFRDMLGIKQGALADMLDMSQQALSLLEQKKKIDDAQMEEIAKALKVPVDAIRNFDEEAVFNIMCNTYHDNSASVHYSFNPIDKIVELYERVIKEKDTLIEKLTNEKK